ncbi:unnamed protein product [Amoebophrya sp. A120]|nr:unnamed protein product [Amoebophrya sp. A120]|eukprot:GSA120T00004561001.1
MASTTVVTAGFARRAALQQRESSSRLRSFSPAAATSVAGFSSSSTTRLFVPGHINGRRVEGLQRSGHGRPQVQVRHFSGFDLKPELETFEHPTLSKADFIKNIRKPVGLYSESLEQIKHEIGKMDSLPGNGSLPLLSEGEKDAYLHSLLANLIFPKAVHTHFDKSCFGLPLFGSAVYSHMWAGVGNHLMAKKPSAQKIDEVMKIITYYRTPIISEELFRMGYSPEKVYELVAKQFYLQYWSGQDNKDPLIFNPMVRTFYPCDSHIGAGSTDLGRDTELQAAKLYCMGKENMEAPVTILNTGDTGFFTDGAMHALQHFAEAREQGYKMPMIFLINANNSAISARFDYGGKYGDLGEYGVKRIHERFELWSNLIDKGFETWAHDMNSGIDAMKKACDQVLETGRPTYVISRWPFRPGGHASDQNPAPEEMLLDQFEKYKNVMIYQLACAAPKGMSGSELVAKIQQAEDSIVGHVEHAIRGCKVMSREQVRELSQPGSTTVLKEEGGEAVDLDINYLLGKGQKKFAGMGSEIYSKAIQNQMDIADKEGKMVRYVHQENHHKGQHDTRGGVYGELQAIGPEHADKFVGFMPQEAQVVQVGAAYRSVLPSGNRVFVKGPHTIFNEHARDHIKYAAYRYCDAGEHANHIYIFDGGSLAFREKEKVIDAETNEETERDMFLARVGEHHNTPEYSSFAGDANTVMCLPIDMNVLSNCMQEMVRLHDMGRMVLGVAPTMSFGMLHPILPLPEHKQATGMQVNDYFKVQVPGTLEPMNGKKLIMIGWGPDCKMIAKVLMQENLNCELIVLNYNRAPNALVNYLDDLATKGVATEVIVVDPNPNSALMSPVVSSIRRRIKYPDDLFFSECTIQNAYVPYGLGDPLIQEKDIYNTLFYRQVIEGVPDLSMIKRVKSRAAAPAAGSAAPASGASGGATETVFAPMDGEGVYISFQKKVGDSVKADEIIAEVESDKATIEITSPINGVIEEIFVAEQKEMDVTGDETKICSVKPAGAAPAAAAPAATPAAAPSAAAATGKLEMVQAPMDGEGVYVKFVKQIGDSVKADELICEVESDKATIEITSPVDGVVKEYFVEENKEINVTGDETNICSVQAMGSAPAAAPAAAASTPAPAASTPAPAAGAPTPAQSASGKFARKSSVGDGGRRKLSRFQQAMVKNMSVGNLDTNCFFLVETVDFKKIITKAKSEGVSPVIVLIKAMAEAAQHSGMNHRLSKNREEMIYHDTVNIGCAIDVAGQLRTAVIKDAYGKSLTEIKDDLARMVALGAKLPAEDQDLSKVCFTVSSLGKDAPQMVIPVLPKATTGILGVGRLQDDKTSAMLTLTVCHAISCVKTTSRPRVVMQICKHKSACNAHPHER